MATANNAAGVAEPPTNSVARFGHRRDAADLAVNDRPSAIVVTTSELVGLGVERAATDAGCNVVSRISAEGFAAMKALPPPDVVVIAADGRTARRLATAVRLWSAHSRIVLLVPLPDGLLVEHALRLGLISVIGLDASAEQLVTSLHAATTGLVFGADAQLAVALGAKPLPAGLTVDDVQVLRLLAKGSTNSGIATQLHLSPNTAKARVSRILRKLGAANRAAAVNRAVEIGVLVGGTEPDDVGKTTHPDG